MSFSLPFAPTGTFTDWKTQDVSLFLAKGINMVKLISATADGLANIDQIGYVSTGLSKGSCVVTETHNLELETLIMNIYPNPSKEGFYLRTSRPLDIQVLDMEGKLKEEYKATSDREIGKTLRSGMYLIKAGNKVYKVLKE